MKDVANELDKIIDGFISKYKDLDEEITGKKLSIDKWTLKEIIGHLIDSASNNHQRFLRLQLRNDLEFPDYNKDDWIKLQKYNEILYSDLLSLFLYYNKLIKQIILNVDKNCLKNKWNVAWDENTNYITLERLIKHYVEHIKGHISHFNERLNEILKNINNI